MERKISNRLGVLAVGDGSGIQDFYRQVFQSSVSTDPMTSDFELAVCGLGHEAVETVKDSILHDNPFAVALIHSAPSSEFVGLRTAEEIRSLDHNMNFVILSEYTDDLGEIALRIPPVSKILYTQQPFYKEDILQYIIVLGAMWLSEKQLQRANKELMDVSSQLMETNNALSVLAKNLENTRKESQRNIIQRTRMLIIPIIEKLQNERRLKQYKAELDLLIDYIESLTSDLSSDWKISSVLSKTELQIASLIKNGMSSEEISMQLNISVLTVKTHRKNIRRKLNLQNTGANLQSFLETGFIEA